MTKNCGGKWRKIMLNFQWIHCSMDILRTEKRNYKKTYWYILFHCSKLARLFELIHSTYQTIRSNQINCKGLQTTICYRFPNPGKDKTRTATSFLELKRLNFFFTLQSVSHFGIGFVQFHLRRKIRSKFSICRLQFWFLRCCQQRWSYCPKFHSVMSQKITKNANLQNISTV